MSFIGKPFASLPVNAMAIIPKSGRPTPVSKKPPIAFQTLCPAACPSSGGYIIFPAPKKCEKHETDNNGIFDR